MTPVTVGNNLNLQLSTKQLTTGSTKHLYRLKNPASEQLNFQSHDGYNKVVHVIECCVV